MTIQKYYYNSPEGCIEILGDTEFILGIIFCDEAIEKNPDSPYETINKCLEQLKSYFREQSMQFELPLKLVGTPFQEKVWTGLRSIPFGTTLSYKQFAINLGDVKAIRAVAHSNGLNPFVIVIPCHRVIGSNGKLTGYSGGLWRKEWLLNHEKRIHPAGQLNLGFNVVSQSSKA